MEKMEKQRLQKVIASSGVYSRRQVERLIEDKKIRVNGVLVTQQGLKVDPLVDKIQVGGKPFYYKAERVTEVIAFNKPRHCVVTRSDPENRPTVYEYLPKRYHVFKPVGRLDFNSQGLLLFTNDGDLLLSLTHPRFPLDKVYEVKISSFPDEKQLQRLRQGVVIDGERTLPAGVEIISENKSSCLLRMTLREGRNRQIRKMCEGVGLTVKELRRVAIGPLKLKGLRGGQHRLLTPKEVRGLKKMGEKDS